MKGEGLLWGMVVKAEYGLRRRGDWIEKEGRLDGVYELRGTIENVILGIKVSILKA